MKHYSYFIINMFFLLFFAFPAQAEVALDGTVGSAGKLDLKGPDYDIRCEYGYQAGANLFHSFQKFNISSEESANFSGPGNVKNIISRVTGGDISYIDGILRSSIEGADLYFLNPAGLIFGPGAALDLSGSFHAGTADYLKMGDNELFYTIPRDGEVLSVSSPSAFGFLDGNMGDITFDGCSIESIGKTFSVIGRNIYVKNSALLTINGGRLNMAAAASKGEVSPGPSYLNVSSAQMGNINISENSEGRQSAIDVRYGSIFIRGGRFVADNSEIRTDTPYAVEDRAESVMDIQADNIELKNGTILSTDAFGRVKGADLNLRASDSVDISGSKIRVGSFGSKASGDAGRLTIQAENIKFTDGALIESESKEKSTGNAGNVILDASESILISDASINTFTTGSGNAGNVNINASDINITGDAEIGAYTAGRGDAGTVSINSKNILLQKNASIKTETENRGNAGKIIMSGSLIHLKDKASVSSSSRKAGGDETGEAGKIILNSDYVSLEQDAVIKTETETIGNAGDILLTAGNLELDGNAALSSASKGSGNAGTITVEALDTVKLSGRSSLTTDAVSSGGGKIAVNAGNTLALFNSEITTSVSKGLERGGDIRIGHEGKGPEFVILNNSKIKANADQGDGGAIFIVTNNYLKSSDSRVEASSKRGNEGIIKISAPDTDIAGSLTLLPHNFTDAGQWIKTPCSQRNAENVSRFVLKQRDGIPFSFEDWLPSQLSVSSEQLSVNGFSLPAAHGSLKKGDFAGLIRTLEKDEKPEIFNAVLLSNAYIMLGRYREALSALQKVSPLVENEENICAGIMFLNTFGDLYLALGDINDAIEYFKQALNTAGIDKNPLMKAGVLNNLGNLRAVNKDFQGAVSAYSESLEKIDSAGGVPWLKSRVLINMARAEYENEKYQDGLDICYKAESEIEKQSGNWRKAADMISLGLLEKQIYKKMKNPEILKHMERLFKHAADIGQKIQNNEILSRAYGGLGQYYEENEEHSKAIHVTRKAVFAAQQGYYPEILYQWQWQMGRLFNKTGEIDRAVEFYRYSIESLNSVRLEFFNGFRGRKNIFDKKVKPVYLELTSLLLEKDNMLTNARDTMEVLKTAELQDFFRDECMTASEIKPGKFSETLDAGTALLYPIPLPDHLALLLNFNDGIKYVRVPADSEHMGDIVRRFREKLEEGEDDFIDDAMELYNWLIRPAENELASHETDTLIIAPEGVLRLIPFAALHSGENFLIEKYALGTVASVNLTNTEPCEKRKYQVLLNGLSESREGFAPLYNVKNEIENIQKVMGGLMLMDKNFTMGNLKKQVINHPYDIVHMATHAVFGDSPEKTFLLTYDDKLNMNTLDQLVRSGKFQDRQLELLTLSACETALGDERAAFGLAGAALRAGAKSTLATLWETYDLAAFLALDTFYREFAGSHISKAKALQKAQKKLIADPEYEHPAFWASFLLIGNWR